MKWGLENKIIQELRDVFALDKSIKQVNLFGSRATGQFKKTSDIDLVLIEVDKGFEFEDLLNLRAKLNRLPILYKIDLLDIKNITNLDLLEEIQTKSVEFYKKNK